MVIIETEKIAKNLELSFQEAELIANRLMGKRIMNLEVYTSRIDNMFCDKVIENIYKVLREGSLLN